MILCPLQARIILRWSIGKLLLQGLYVKDLIIFWFRWNSCFRAELFGYEVDQIAQTAFRGYDTVEDVVDDLLDEDYNLRRFVVDADYIHVGLAMREGFWTQVFASSHDEDESCIDDTI